MKVKNITSKELIHSDECAEINKCGYYLKYCPYNKQKILKGE